MVLMFGFGKSRGLGVSGWRWDPLRSFSVRSAYSLLTNTTTGSEDKDWSLTGKFKGSPRIQSFLWLVYWDRILTNQEIVRWSLASDASCSNCGATVEDTLHVLCECPVATAIWSMVIKPELLEEFYSLDLREWLCLNLDGICCFPGKLSTLGHHVWLHIVESLDSKEHQDFR
ncbi:hypothetical protein V6N13_048905 [Hibiscus sabdariffa]|uniref:Reverse transcriptase zinc-binding domain-containing protein n=1 Tax=Hibiscus sabdariffa TaxID=183260 RepID=A0ABR2QYW2_9ROSI